MKTYVKPDLYYENFELSQSVASCSVTDSSESKSTNFHSGNVCTYDYGIALFTDSNTSCDAKISEFEEYCYQTGSDGYNFFAS